jgi:hypothetical protein
MKLLAGVALLLAIGAGLGTYFAFRGSSVPEVPKAEQNAILERAKAEVVIDAYRVKRFDQAGWDYRVVGADIRLSTQRVLAYCGGDYSRPNCLPNRLLFLEYRRPATKRAFALLRVAHATMPDTKIKFFEVTSLDGSSGDAGFAHSHTPDARIMLIPIAGA